MSHIVELKFGDLAELIKATEVTFKVVILVIISRIAHPTFFVSEKNACYLLSITPGLGPEHLLLEY